METCDVLIVGGGPGGSSCAWGLRRAGLDVVVMDRAAFPRDKVCAGWITPRVGTALEIDFDDYRRGRTLQPITAFRTGLIGGRREVETAYHQPVSYGIRRCEFDWYLLQRSGARLILQNPVSSIRREGTQWVVNDSIKAAMLVGAGGHFCPVARWLNPTIESAPLVVAQEAELRLEPRTASAWSAAPGIPELYFCRDLKGYGWCFRKGDYLNVGLGRLDRRSLPGATSDFLAFLRARHKAPDDAAWRWHGHAYHVLDAVHRRVFDAGVMLVGDAAGRAYPQSGEGIWPAIESGLVAVSTIVEADGRYTRERIEPYEQRLAGQPGGNATQGDRLATVAPGIAAIIGRRLMNVPWFVRHVVLDRWFLRTHEGGQSPLESSVMAASR